MATRATSTTKHRAVPLYVFWGSYRKALGGALHAPLVGHALRIRPKFSGGRVLSAKIAMRRDYGGFVSSPPTIAQV